MRVVYITHVVSDVGWMRASKIRIIEDGRIEWHNAGLPETIDSSNGGRCLEVRSSEEQGDLMNGDDPTWMRAEPDPHRLIVVTTQWLHE